MVFLDEFSLKVLLDLVDLILVLYWVLVIFVNVFIRSKVLDLVLNRWVYVDLLKLLIVVKKILMFSMSRSVKGF